MAALARPATSAIGSITATATGDFGSTTSASTDTISNGGVSAAASLARMATPERKGAAAIRSGASSAHSTSQASDDDSAPARNTPAAASRAGVTWPSVKISARIGTMNTNCWPICEMSSGSRPSNFNSLPNSTAVALPPKRTARPRRGTWGAAVGSAGAASIRLAASHAEHCDAASASPSTVISGKGWPNTACAGQSNGAGGRCEKKASWASNHLGAKLGA